MFQQPVGRQGRRAIGRTVERQIAGARLNLSNAGVAVNGRSAQTVVAEMNQNEARMATGQRLSIQCSASCGVLVEDQHIRALQYAFEGSFCRPGASFPCSQEFKGNRSADAARRAPEWLELPEL